MSKEINGVMAIPSELQIHLLEEQGTALLHSLLLLSYSYKQPMTLEKNSIQKLKGKTHFKLITKKMH